MALPSFSGDILQWQPFWDSYESKIHANTNLTDVQKFTYLKSQLEGSAASVIEGFAMTNTNDARAIDLLKERFGQQQKITHAAMQALLKLPAPSNKVSSLRNFYDKMETYIRSLEAMGQCQESYGSLLVLENGTSEWTLEELRRAINKEIAILEAGTTHSDPGFDDYVATASFHTGARPGKRAQPHRNSSTGGKAQRGDIKCAFCDGGHRSNDCTTYSDADSRMKVVKDKRLCFNCLGKHPVAKCSSSNRCLKCRRKHHTTICNSRPAGNQPESLPTSSETAVLHSNTTLPDKEVLLKTAIATVTSQSHVQTTANILFDEGAQKSFITEQLATQLNLKKETTETIYLSSFGSTTNKLQQVDVATVHAVTDDRQTIPVRVLIVPTISTPINNKLQHAVSKYPYLRGLKLAHPGTADSSFTISMLIGADFYWDLVEDHVVRGNGPTAMKSKLGYLLSGPVHVQPDDSRATEHILNVLATPLPADMLERFWSLESMGISKTSDDMDKTDYFKNYQKSPIEHKNGSYTAKLPWKRDHPELPSNYDVSEKRTVNLIRRLQNDPPLLEKYDEIISEQERRGFIEKVNSDTPPTGPVHYIPHRPVKKDSTTTPIRIVYSCTPDRNCHTFCLGDKIASHPGVLTQAKKICKTLNKPDFGGCCARKRI